MFMFAVLVFFALDIAVGPSSKGCKAPDKGKVTGQVTFSGLPCQPGQPDFNVPPCTGPYPNYKIEVYEGDDKKNLRLTAMSDSKGNFSIELASGDYVIYTPNGPMENNLQKNAFHINKGEVSRLDLRVSTGIQ